MAKFINPFTDVGFKRVFGQEISKPLILDFLNNLLLGEEHITDITFLDKEQPALYEDDRSLVYDIYCETDSGKKVIVEMQNKTQPYFKDRSIYYTSEAIARQGERGSSWNYDIAAVYLLAWIYVLKNMDTLTRLPWAAKSAVFQRLEQIADVASLSKHDRMKYDEGLRKYRDTLSVLEGARRDGLDEGRERGLAEGRAEGRAEGAEAERHEMARRLLEAGVDKATIKFVTGMDEETLSGLCM